MGVEEGGGACGSDLHELSTSPGSFLGCWSRAINGLFSSSMLLWSDGVEGLDDETVGGGRTPETSSENIDMSCSSSKRSKALFDPCITAVVVEFRHSSMKAGASRKAMESLMDLRWAPRLEDEKSRNSSTQDGCCCWVAEMKFAIIGILWWEEECQFCVMLGILGGNCAI